MSSSGHIGAPLTDSSASGLGRRLALNPQLGVEGLEAVDLIDPRRNEVFRAHKSADPTDGVVVKLLKPEFQPILSRRHGAGSRKLIRAVKKSDGWVPVLWTGTNTNGRNYIVQPHYPRGSLLDLLGQGGHWRSSLSMVGDAAAVVGQLGARRLALGCLRPSYLLIDDDTVVVSIFGMSTRRFDDGTTQYLAPEQQDGSKPTPVCDVYTLGLILAELLADRQRRPDEPVQDLITTLPDSIPAMVIDLLDHAVTSSVTNRIANAALLHRAITRLLTDLPNDAADSPIRDSAQPGGSAANPPTCPPTSSSWRESLEASAHMAPRPADGPSNGLGPGLDELKTEPTRTTVGSDTTAYADHDHTRPENAITATNRLDEVEDDHGSMSPDLGPLADLLKPGMVRPATNYRRPTTGSRLAAELELEMLIEVLSELPTAAGRKASRRSESPESR